VPLLTLSGSVQATSHSPPSRALDGGVERKQALEQQAHGHVDRAHLGCFAMYSQLLVSQTERGPPPRERRLAPSFTPVRPLCSSWPPLSRTKRPPCLASRPRRLDGEGPTGRKPPPKRCASRAVSCRCGSIGRPGCGRQCACAHAVHTATHTHAPTHKPRRKDERARRGTQKHARGTRRRSPPSASARYMIRRGVRTRSPAWWQSGLRASLLSSEPRFDSLKV